MKEWLIWGPRGVVFSMNHRPRFYKVSLLLGRFWRSLASLAAVMGAARIASHGINWIIMSKVLEPPVALSENLQTGLNEALMFALSHIDPFVER